MPASGGRKRSAPFSVSKDSETTRSSKQQKTRGKRKATRVNDKTLNPIDGSLHIRLDTDIQHLPNDNVNELKNSSRQCALHRW